MNRCKEKHGITGKNKQGNSQTQNFVKSHGGRDQKPCNKFFINLVCLVCTGKYLPSRFSPQTLLSYENLREIPFRTNLTLD